MREELTALIEVGHSDNASSLAVRVNDLDFELNNGYTITREDVTQLEFMAHRMYCEIREEVRATKDKMERLKAMAPPRRTAPGF